jgi:hypothetical protein
MHEIDAADSCELFRKLTDRGNGSFFYSIIVAIDAGVDTAWNKTESKDLKQWFRPWFI